MKGFRSATMLYRRGTEARIHDVHVDTKVVDEHEIDEHLGDGWHLTPTGVKKAAEAEAVEAAAMAAKAAKDAPAKPAADKQ